jgi:hypothetical protein
MVIIIHSETTIKIPATLKLIKVFYILDFLDVKL